MADSTEGSPLPAWFRTLAAQGRFNYVIVPSLDDLTMPDTLEQALWVVSHDNDRWYHIPAVMPSVDDEFAIGLCGALGIPGIYTNTWYFTDSNEFCPDCVAAHAS